MEEKVKELLEKLGGDKEALKKLVSNPEAALKEHGIDLSPEQMKKAVEDIKDKVDLGDLEKKAEGLLGNLFKKD